MDVHDLLRIIRFNWVLLMMSALLGATSGLVLAAVRSPEYVATAQVFVGVTDGGSTGELAQGMNYAQLQARNFSAVATKEIVLGPVIKDLSLGITVSQLRGKASASPQVNTSLISVSVQDSDPAQAARVANAIASSLSEAATSLAPDIEGLKGSPIKLEVVESATAPSSPTVPNTPLWVVSAGAIALLLGCIWVAVHEFAVARVRTPEQFARLSDLPLLGSISEDHSIPDQPLAMIADPYSPRSEEYRKLRSSLQFLSPGESRKAFVITSSVSGEGKSTTAANLAVAIAASGKSVCLVEGDLRRPSLDRTFDLPAGIGLTTVLSGAGQLDDVLQPWGMDGLNVLLAGEVPPNPSELLESGSALQLFDELRSRFDVVVVDAPPALAVADASILAQQFGSLLLVVGARRVQVREVGKALGQLETIGQDLLGYIFTGTEDNRFAYRYYRQDKRASAANRPRPVMSQAASAGSSDRANREPVEEASPKTGREPARSKPN